MVQESALYSDRPIEKRADDRLGRARFAESIAHQIATAPADDGFVFALVGPWGIGKTSILNMVCEVLASNPNIVLLRFNPWLFSGTEQLVARFFREISAQLIEKPDSRLRALGTRLKQYGQLLSPFRFMPQFGKALEIVSEVFKAIGDFFKGTGDNISIEAQRRALDDVLRRLNRRLVVIIDDIDRPQLEEIRDVMRLVRLTADFPNTVYVLAFDRKRVEEALAEMGEDGRDYLEKIVQVIHDVPEVSEAELTKLLLNGLEEVTNNWSHGPFDPERWPNVFYFVIRPLFKTVRDVKRYLGSLPATLQIIGDEVAVVDVLALEAVRILLPDVFALLPSAFEPLTTPSTLYIGVPSDERHDKKMTTLLQGLIDAGGEYSAAIRDLYAWLFPTSKRYLANVHYTAEHLKNWRKERRVAHPEVFRFYLEKHLPPDKLPARTIQEIFDALGNEEALTKLISQMDSSTLEQALERLEDYEDDYLPDTIENAVQVLMNHYPRLREGRQGMGDFGADLKLSRVVLRLLKRIADESERTAIMERVLPKLNTLSARLHLVRLVGHEEGVGHELIPKETADWLGEQMRVLILEAGPQALSSERDLYELLAWAAVTGDESDKERVKEIIENDRVFLRLLHSSLAEAFAQTSGTVSVRMEYRLLWDGLTSMFGEEILQRRIHEVATSVDKESLDKRSRLALELAERYASGWRPPRF